MTLLEILLHELEGWPAGKEYAFQSTTSRIAFFASSQTDDNLKSVILSQIASNRGPHHKVSREEWETAKIKSLPFFKGVANTLGEERAVKELLAVGKISSTAKVLEEAFVFYETPQGREFWRAILEPDRGPTKLNHAFRTVIAALDPEHYLLLQQDGSGSVRDRDDKEIHYFAHTDSLVSEYLSPPPKFDHWDLLQDRYKWIAKDSNGIWWVYEDRPTLEALGWKTNGECRSLSHMKIDIQRHWSRSLIPRPSTI